MVLLTELERKEERERNQIERDFLTYLPAKNQMALRDLGVLASRDHHDLR